MLRDFNPDDDEEEPETPDERKERLRTEMLDDKADRQKGFPLED